MLRKTLYVLYLIVLIEATSFVGLQIFASVKQLHYQPIRDKSIATEHRLIIQSLIDNTLPYLAFSSVTGWIPRPDTSYTDPHGIHYTSDESGLRKNAQGERTVSGGLKIACFGDSFTHGDEVQDDETYPAYLERLSGVASARNYGIPAGDPGQALLYFQSLQSEKKAELDIVLFGFMTENINRLHNVYRPFYQADTGMPFVKPRLELNEQGIQLVASYKTATDYLTLLDDPAQELARLGNYDWFYQHAPKRRWYDVFSCVRLIRMLRYEWFPADDAPLRFGHYNVESKAFQLAEEVLMQSLTSAEERGAQAAVVFFPTKRELLDMKEPLYSPLMQRLKHSGVAIIDGHFCIKDQVELPYTRAGGHYTPAVNKRLAECIKQTIDTLDLSKKVTGINSQE